VFLGAGHARNSSGTAGGTTGGTTGAAAGATTEFS